MSTSRASRQIHSAFIRAVERPQLHTKSRNTHVAVRYHRPRLFHASASLGVVKPYLLADIGEGITECQIIQWFVQPGAKVAQFDKICEVQSDKAAVEITSRFDGVIKKLHYEADDMAKVGAPLVDIDIQSEISEEDEKLTQVEAVQQEPGESQRPIESKSLKENETGAKANDAESSLPEQGRRADTQSTPHRTSGKHASLATPAVRHLTRELKIDITDVVGTGKDGRVLKEDVQKFAAQRDSPSDMPISSTPTLALPSGEDRVVKLSGIQKKMYQTMTHSLTIPHFLYSDTVDFTSLNKLRKSMNTEVARSSATDIPKLSALPFIIKAASLALSQYPSINAHLDTKDPNNVKYTHRAAHNIGFAVDTPQGLIVPVIRNVQAHSIISIATEVARLGKLARNNKLASSDLTDATFTVSNIGAIGGTTVAPVIVSPQVAILGVGKSKAVPAFADDGSVVRKEETVFSWSADHRVVDGATVARCAETMRRYLENMETMLVRLR